MEEKMTLVPTESVRLYLPSSSITGIVDPIPRSGFPGRAVLADVGSQDLRPGLGFLHSDATYDTVHVWDGRFFRLNLHLDRFFRGMRRLRTKLPYSCGEIEGILANCVALSGHKCAYVEMICTRGASRPSAATRARRKTVSLPSRCPSGRWPTRNSWSVAFTSRSATRCVSLQNPLTLPSRTTIGSIW
ncbi:aminotransferase class IV [Mesorhizobium sp. M1423]|uniref:aminotransferase class IV n=1 Tax=Mesorhizobium sp. M1423 TaxID=2957101 RepID=UPI0033365D23